jgi:putative peptide zinc metalloprotease protein
MNLEDAGARTFSDAWHRVSGVRAQLRSSVIAHRQHFRGQPWVILRDRFNSEWFRLTPDAYAFLCRLGQGRTVDQAWNDGLAVDPDRALTQEEVVQLLGQLNLSNLLQYDRGDAAVTQFERLKKRRTRETQQIFMGIMSIKVPLFDPDRWLERALPVIRLAFGPIGLTLYLLLLLAGGKALMDEAPRLFEQGAGLLAPANLGLLYLGFLLSKALHEISHAAVCKHFGGEVHKLGLMFLIFAPMPYVDATSAWGFRRRRERVLVGLAGVLAELALAAACALLWAYTAPGTLNSLAHNIIFVASVSTLVFNLNPLLRFDGYHVLVDLLGVPNLFQRSREQLRYLAERHLLRLPHAVPGARTPTESWLLPTYGVLSLAYWLLLMVTIITFVAGEYFEVGVALALFMLFVSLVLPSWKLVRYLAASPSLAFHRTRAIAISTAMLAITLGLLAGVPMPDRVRVTGVVQAGQTRQMHVSGEGFLRELMVTPGSPVQAGQELLRLDNPDLVYQIRLVRMQLAQLQAQEVQAVAAAVADLSAIVRQRQAIEDSLQTLLEREQSLLVRAPVAGIWVASDLEGANGQWLARGAPAGTVVNQEAWRFVGVLPQVGGHVFGDSVRQAEVRLRGEEGINLPALSTQVMPFEQGQLPARALGMAGGGEIAVANSDPQGLTAIEPFFRIESVLSPEHAQALLVHGRVGTLRLTLSSRPLLQQWERSARQFLQRKFRV